MLKVKNSQVKYLEAAHQELFHRPSKTEFDLKKELCMLCFNELQDDID
jgi:hypothetical protein